MESTLTSRVPNDLQAVPIARERFVRWWGDQGVGGEELCAWQLIFDELVNNSIEHGCKTPEDEVSVESRVSEEKVELCVVDPAEGALTEASFPTEPNGAFHDLGRGAGLVLIRAFTDEIHVGPAENGGTLIRAVKYRGKDT